MRFKYTATNTEGKQLTGVINAPTEAEARTKLNNLGFSILEINVADETVAETSDLEKFEFEAMDKNGKQIKGSIPAKTPLLAYKRLLEEYSFTIHYLAPQNASAEEKAQAHQSGVQALQTEYELEKQKKSEAETPQTVETPEFLAEKEKLIQRVDTIIAEIKQLLTKFQGKISPEKQSLIQGYIDKLLRIKSSNNLDYIHHTCEDMLKKIQEEELFLSTQQHGSERKALLLESQKMMLELQKSTSAKIDTGLRIRTKIQAVEEKLKGTSFEFLLEPIHYIRSWFDVEPEMQRLTTQLKTNRSQTWDALKIAIKSPKEARHDAWLNVKHLKQQGKEIRAAIKTKKHLRHEKNLVVKKERHIYFIEEIQTFTGWLLFFYLAYYFFGFYVTSRGLAIEPFIGIPYDLGESVLFKYLLSIIFLVHAAASLKINFFLRSRLADGILIPVTLALCLMTLFNF